MKETGMKQGLNLLVPATVEGLNIGDLPLGSIQSRAAARLLLEEKRKGEKRREIVICIEGAKDASEASEWTQDRDGTLERVIWLTPGSVLTEGLRSVGGFSSNELEEIAAIGPEFVPDFEIFEMNH
jgi:hypothetical protein